MTQADKQALLDAGRAYEALFVPALFDSWTGRVADAAEIAIGHRVLDVACGTGVLARDVARRVGDQGSVAGVDPSIGLLEVARQLAPAVEWTEGTAEALPFDDRSFDRVVSQFGFMFFGDPAQAAREILRVLAPGGRFAVAVWGPLESMPAYAREVRLLDRMAGAAAANALRAPFAMGDRDRLADLFRAAGAAPVAAATRAGTARFPSIRIMVEADLRAWMPMVGIEMSEEQIEEILREAEGDLAEYATASGTMQFETCAHIISGARP